MSVLSVLEDSCGVNLIIVDVIFFALAVVAVGLRLWARRIMKTRLCLNDYAIILALVLRAFPAWGRQREITDLRKLLTTALVTTALFAVITGGAGQHIGYVSQQQLTRLFKGYVAANSLWACSNAAVRISILDLYLNIFPYRRFRTVVYATIAVTVCFCTVVVLQACLTCRPFSKFWDRTIPGTCGDIPKVFIPISVFNLLIDIFVVVLPMPMLWGLQMPVSRKVALTIIFGLGAVICVITIFRIVTLVYFNTADFTYDLAQLAVWVDLELTLGIINACLPVIKPVLTKLFKSKLLSWVTRNKDIRTFSNKWLSGVTASRVSQGNRKATNFRRLDDDTYPLAERDVNYTLTNITTGNKDISSHLEAPSTAQGISVQTDWTIRSASM